MNIFLKRSFTIFISLIGMTYGSHAQSIKQQAEQQKRQQQEYNNELKEQAYIKKAQLNLQDLLLLLKSKDLGYIDGFLAKKGWKLDDTVVREADGYKDDSTQDYESVTWSFEKDTKSGLALGWFTFHLYHQYDNVIEYPIIDEKQLSNLKSDLSKNGYQRTSLTEATERGLTDTYRDNSYQITLNKKIKKRNEKGPDIRYVLTIYNYKQVEARQREIARLAREEAIRDAEFQEAVKSAVLAYNQNQYTTAKRHYQKALAIKPEERKKYSDRLSYIEIKILSEEAESLFAQGQYDEAKEKYQEALRIKPNADVEYIESKIKEVEDFQQFLVDRFDKAYDYEMFAPEDYHAKSEYIEEELRKSLLANEESIAKTTVHMVYEVDTLGQTVSSFKSSNQNKSLTATLEKLSKDIRLNPCDWNGYAAMATAEFIYTVEHRHARIAVKHTPKGISSNHEDFDLHRQAIRNQITDSTPYGEYTFDMDKTLINGEAHDSGKLVELKGMGASNALWSVLVPGLGNHKVTYGKDDGIYTALWTYGMIGAGIGLKIYSNNEYAKYHKATERSVMDEHYQIANNTHKAFYAAVGIGAASWVSNIIWVASKGAKNTKEINKYKKSHLGVYYQPDVKAPVLSYTLKF